MEVHINPEFEKLIPPLSPDEFAQLEANILAEGVRDPLVIAVYPDDNGQELTFLADGHNRYRIAQKHGLPFAVAEMAFSDKDQAMAWMDKNQIGRRNLSPDMMSYIRGRMYNRMKKAEGRPIKKLGQNVPVSTAELIAQQTGVTDRTIKRDEQYFKAVEKVATALDKPGAHLIHQNIATKKDVTKLAEIVAHSPSTLLEISERIEAETTPSKTLTRDIIHEYERKEVNEIDAPRVCPYDSNMFYESAERSEARYGDKIFSLNDSKYNTVSTLSRFFHSETGMEFTLREYAQVQTFPDSFKFVGNYTTIKKQIGNAVAPYMGAYITKLVQGKTVGDLFAGCGGFSCGAHENGFKTKWAVEWDEYAAKSFKLNFPDSKVYQTSIKALNPAHFEKVDIIIGGPPCQGFSSANHENKKVRPEDRFADDPRNELYKEFLRFVEYLQPSQFIMENVPEIQDVKFQIIEDFNGIGYAVETKLVLGNEIGMKQNRKRFFFIGTKIN